MITTGNARSNGGWLGLVPLPLLAFGLIPGPREILLIMLVALVLYGRSGVRVLQTDRSGRPVSPWVRLLRRLFSPVPAHSRRRKAEQAAAAARSKARSTAIEEPVPSSHGRFFWALALIAAVAVASWIATRAAMHFAALPR